MFGNNEVQRKTTANCYRSKLKSLVPSVFVVALLFCNTTVCVSAELSPQDMYNDFFSQAKAGVSDEEKRNEYNELFEKALGEAENNAKNIEDYNEKENYIINYLNNNVSFPSSYLSKRDLYNYSLLGVFMGADGDYNCFLTPGSKNSDYGFYYIFNLKSENCVARIRRGFSPMYSTDSDGKHFIGENNTIIVAEGNGLNNHY